MLVSWLMQRLKATNKISMINLQFSLNFQIPISKKKFRASETFLLRHRMSKLNKVLDKLKKVQRFKSLDFLFFGASIEV